MRYKIKKFADFRGGEGQEYMSDNGKYFKSSGVRISQTTGKLRLLEDVTYAELTDNVNNPRCIAQDGTYVFVLIYDTGATRSKLYRSSDGINFSLVYTFSATFGQAHMLASFGKFLVAFSSDGYVATSYNSDGSGWNTEIAYPFSAPYSALAFGGSFFVADNTAFYISTDGKNYTKYANIFDNPLQETDLECMAGMSGFLYYAENGTLFRFENGQRVAIRKFPFLLQLMPLGDDMLFLFGLVGSDVRMFLFDGDTFMELNPLIGVGNPIPLYSFGQNGMFVCNSTEVYQVTHEGAVFRMYSLPSGKVGTSGVRFKNSDLVSTQGTANKVRIYRNYNYRTAGTFETPIIDEGEIIPIQLILRHKPLPANTAINVYVKNNYNASWGLLLVSNTTGSVKKKYNFANGYGIFDFVQFEIELTTSDSAVTPDDVQLEFLYSPTGLENAK